MLSKIVSDFQVRFDRSDQRGLRFVLGLQGTEDLLVNGVGYRQVLDDDRLGCLALPPQPCDGLLVKLKAPCQPKPHEAVAACLQPAFHLRMLSEESSLENGICLAWSRCMIRCKSCWNQ